MSFFIESAWVMETHGGVSRAGNLSQGNMSKGECRHAALVRASSTCCILIVGYFLIIDCECDKVTREISISEL